MIWQRVCLAVTLAAGSAFWGQGAVAQGFQTDDPPDYAGSTPQRVDHSQPAPQHTLGPKVIVEVNLTTQRMHVHFPDGADETWPIASGRPGLDTPDGLYKPQWIDPDHVSKQYQDSPMPYAVFFDLKGHAFHGSYQKSFGRAVSHGCVRLPVNDAKRLFDAVKVSSAEITITGKALRGTGTEMAVRQEDQREAQDQRAAPAAYSGQNDGQGYGQQPGYGQPNYGYVAYDAYGNPIPANARRRAAAPPPPPQPQPSFFGGLFGGPQ
jgi:hypothetical protein